MANYNYYHKSKAMLEDYAQQYRDLGREVKVYSDRLVVFDRPQTPAKPEVDKQPKQRVRYRSKEDYDYGE